MLVTRKYSSIANYLRATEKKKVTIITSKKKNDFWMISIYSETIIITIKL